MKKKTNFRLFNTVTWSAIAVLTLYLISKNKEYIMSAFESGGANADCISLDEGHDMISGYFSKNYLADSNLIISKVPYFETEADGENGGEDGSQESEQGETVETINQTQNVSENLSKIEELVSNKNYEYLRDTFYTVDSTTSVTESLLNPKKLLDTDLSIEKNSEEPQILIYHTHSTEKFSDSRDGVSDDTVVGVGEYLAQLLREEGYNVLHDTSAYDVIDGKWNRNAYETALESLEKIMADNPSILVTIDIHRDSGTTKEVTTIDGRSTARVMFFNGVSRTRTGTRSYLENPNLSSNLAFSLALQLKSMENYENFSKKIYIKGYRYNLHLAGRSMLIEVGNDKNTVEEAKNAMIPFSQILVEVLEGN